MLKIEEEELGFKPDRQRRARASKVLFNETKDKKQKKSNTLAKQHFDSDGEGDNENNEDSDSGSDDGGLGGALKAELLEEIGDALNKFS